ncbi:phospholipase domain-containing protein [Streptomyces sp. NPDC059582]|uniref:phospholipase domain-containing protein n=1 Tax=Streptomyces sp. NPDC059582 TaxID=3346875 RepID=UPI0036B7835C
MTSPRRSTSSTPTSSGSRNSPTRATGPPPTPTSAPCRHRRRRPHRSHCSRSAERATRALPYELHTDASTDPGEGTVTLQFLNTGHKGAVFHVYDRLHLDRIPRRYTVEAGKRLADIWDTMATDSGAYDLEVHGPGGFFRSFAGTTASEGGPELRVRYDRHGKSAVLTVRNPGPKAVTLHVEPHAYRFSEPRTIHVPAREEVERHWSLKPSGHSYDFTVTMYGSSLERRFAGRVETGRDGISDPAMAAHLQRPENPVVVG